MKKQYLVLYLIILSFPIFSQNYFPVKRGDTLLYRRQYFTATTMWDSYVKEITEERVYDSLRYLKVYGYWYRYDQPNQKLYTYDNGQQLLSVDFNPGSYFTGAIMGVRRNFHTSLTSDSLLFGISDSIPYSGLWLTHTFNFKKNLGYINDYNLVEHIDYMEGNVYNLLEARGSNYSLSIAKPTLTVASVPSAKGINEFPLYIGYTQTHPYPALIDTVCVFINVYRNDSLIIQKVWQDMSKTYFKVAVTPSQIMVGDIVKINFLLSDSSLSRNKIRVPAYGSYSITVTDPTDVKDEEKISYYLGQNYPNPFNPSTTISYSLPKAGNVKLTIYDAIGCKVTTIVDEYKPAGNYSVQFYGSNLASGIYLYRLESGNYSAAKKFILMK